MRISCGPGIGCCGGGSSIVHVQQSNDSFVEVLITRPEVKTSLNVLVIVQVTFDCGCLTRQKLVFLYHKDIADRFSLKKWDILDFRFENIIPRIINSHRTLDKQAKQTMGTALHHIVTI